MIAKEFAADYIQYLEQLETHLNNHRKSCSQEMAARLLERINDFKTFVAVLNKITADCEQKEYMQQQSQIGEA